MKYLKVPRPDAEVTKHFLISHRQLNHEYAVESDESWVYFPLVEGVEPELEYEVEERAGHERNQLTDLKVVLQSKLNAKEMEHLKTAYDLVGDIAIIEVDKALEKRATMIGEALLSLFSNIHVVLQRGKHTGTYRVQKLKHLAGEKRKETVHKENGVLLKLDVEKVYFSARLSTERKRIASLIEPGERVLVMFAGCGPYPCVLAKHSRADEVIGVEINPEGHAYAEENAELNKLTNVSFICGDARSVLPTIEGSFDRVVLPLPKEAESFLDIALPKVVQGGVIHLYQFWQESEMAANTEKILVQIRKLGYDTTVEDVVMCGQQSPGVYRICLDLRVM